MNRFIIWLAPLAATSMLLAGCDKAASDAKTAEANADSPMPEVLAGADGMSRTSQALKQTGLATAFEGAGSYTLLAPTDTAFDKLPKDATALEGEEGGAAMAALMRNHILPGFATSDDIIKAIAAAPDKRVEMRTMGGQDLTFTSDGDTIVISSPDGAKARVTGQDLRAGASNALAIDQVLAKI